MPLGYRPHIGLPCGFPPHGSQHRACLALQSQVGVLEGSFRWKRAGQSSDQRPLRSYHSAVFPRLPPSSAETPEAWLGGAEQV